MQNDVQTQAFAFKCVISLIYLILSFLKMKWKAKHDQELLVPDLVPECCFWGSWVSGIFLYNKTYEQGPEQEKCWSILFQLKDRFTYF